MTGSGMSTSACQAGEAGRKIVPDRGPQGSLDPQKSVIDVPGLGVSPVPPTVQFRPKTQCSDHRRSITLVLLAQLHPMLGHIDV